MNKLKAILEATASWPSVVVREACAEFPTLKPGDFVVLYKDDLFVTCEDGSCQITYGGWFGDFTDPVPVLLLILQGYLREIPTSSDRRSILALLDESDLEDFAVEPAGNN